MAGGFRVMGVPFIVKDSYTLEGTLKEVMPGLVADFRAMALGKSVQGKTKTLESVLERIHTSTQTEHPVTHPPTHTNTHTHTGVAREKKVSHFHPPGMVTQCVARFLSFGLFLELSCI